MQTFTPGVLCKRSGRWYLDIKHTLEFDTPEDAIRFAEAVKKLNFELPVDPGKMLQKVEEEFKHVARRNSVVINW